MEGNVTNVNVTIKPHIAIVILANATAVQKALRVIIVKNVTQQITIMVIQVKVPAIMISQLTTNSHLIFLRKKIAILHK